MIFSNRRRMTLDFQIFCCSWQCCSVVYSDRLPWRALQQDPCSQYNTAILQYTPCPAALWGKETPVAIYIVPISSTSKVLYYILLNSRGDESLTVGRLVSLSDTVASGGAKNTVIVTRVGFYCGLSQLSCFWLMPTLCKQLNDIWVIQIYWHFGLSF